jgi:transcriptional regulator with XRE-family HTH domain
MEPIDLGALLRRVRRDADLSQRELAVRAGVQQVLVSRIESGRVTNPCFRTVELLLNAAGLTLTAASDGAEPIPHENLRDEGDRHYPAHLDVREVKTPEDWGGAWWTDWYRLPERLWPLPVPNATYDLSRDRRDRRRIRDDTRRRAVVRQESAWHWVAEMPGVGLIGELRAARDDDAAGLRSLHVVPPRRNAGVARRLMECLLAEAEREGLPRVESIADLNGVRFLRRFGFREVDRLTLLAAVSEGRRRPG